MVQFRPRWVLVLAALGLFSVTFVVVATAQTICPPDWSGAQRIRLANNDQTALGDPPVAYRVHLSIGRDFAPKVVPRIGSQHPLVAVLSIQAATPAEMAGVTVSCIHVTRDAESWSRRPRTYAVTTSPGNPAAGAWRVWDADGPEWEVGENVDVEIWLEVGGQRYLVALGPFTIYKGL